MKTEVLRRTFEAENYPKGSPERIKLNEKALTSEYMHSMKYIARIYLEANENMNEVIHKREFRTKAEAEEWINDNAERLERDHKLTLHEYMRNNL
jgi:hypothetical protein